MREDVSFLAPRYIDPLYSTPRTVLDKIEPFLSRFQTRGNPILCSPLFHSLVLCLLEQREVEAVLRRGFSRLQQHQCGHGDPSRMLWLETVRFGLEKRDGYDGVQFWAVKQKWSLALLKRQFLKIRSISASKRFL